MTSIGTKNRISNTKSNNIASEVHRQNTASWGDEKKYPIRKAKELVNEVIANDGPMSLRTA